MTPDDSSIAVEEAPPSVAGPGHRFQSSLFLMAALFTLTGVLHFVIPLTYQQIVPPWLPNAPLLVQVSGISEVLGALGLLWAPTRRAAGWGLVLLLIFVFPANIEMLRQAQAAQAARTWQAILWLRLPLQGVLIWWVWRAAVQVRR